MTSSRLGKGRLILRKRKEKKYNWITIISWVACILIIILILCALPVFGNQISGIENYSPADSTLSLSKHLYPSDDFLCRFDYTDGDYQYYYNGVMLDGYAVAFSLLQYCPEQYKAAKQFCLQNFTKTDEHQYQVNGYHFMEHLCYEKEIGVREYAVSCLYPEMFNMFGYNDSIHTLIFLGYYEPNSDPETQLALTDFEAFYNHHFAKYYVLE